MTTPIDTYRVDLPDNWSEIPTSDSGLENHFETVWKGAGIEGPAGATARRRLDVLRQQLGHDLATTSTCLVAGFMELVATSESDGDEATASDLVAASVTLSILTRADLGTDLPLRVETLLSAMGSSRSAPTTESVDVEPPAIVELLPGRSVRLRRLNSFTTGPFRHSKIYSETYLVPVSPEWQQVCVLQFSTPCVEDSRLFSELFELIASTFRFYREGEPTELT